MSIIEVAMPKLSPTMTDGKIVMWHKNEGDYVNEEEVLCEIATDKSTMEFTSIEKGFLRKLFYKEGEIVGVGEILALITEKKEEDISFYEKKAEIQKEEITNVIEKKEVQKTAMAFSLPAFAPAPPRTNYEFEERDEFEKIAASPLAKKLAKEKGLDLASVKGSGPNGRIIAKDLEFAQSKGPFSIDQEMRQLPPGTYEEIALTPVRKVIGERLQASKISIPHYYITDEVRVDKLIDVRAQLKEAGLKVTYNDFVLRAVALALKKHPEINSGFNSENQTIIRFKTIDISLAVSIPEGLITPILFHANFKDIFTLSEEAKRLALRAKENSLKPEEYQGGSFTVSNLGMFGIKSFDAVINPPQAAILAVGGIFEKGVVEGGKLVPGSVMHLTLSLDHRVIDGAEGAKFLHTLKVFLTNPAILLI
ncbi:MAG: pyruvate dehydrogenase complex dihydrolipoamide acetyltransferase [Chlamydiae bacterium]|jgi:pyruvate dehydrogenase E2 component (dihydrolipoamide acetyltransferase)|nr:pyruvate dehydrogenase complex dihydrolipoamide acetyltransferase [Chlamydiota bacterium]